MIKKIYLAKPRGFCAGVTRAVSIVDLALKKYGPPLFVKHQIVHNRHVVSDFEKKGVIFVEELDKVPDGSRIIFSAHGTPPRIYEQAKQKKLLLIDAVCPLVTKVHLEVKRYEKEGYFIFYLGHRNHPEGKGVLGEVSPKSIVLLETLEEVQKIKPPKNKKLMVLTQTTLSFDDTKIMLETLKKRFPDMMLPPTFDICYATQNRQAAVKELAKKVDLILVIGSTESSNSQRLKEVAKKQGVKAYLINDQTEVNPSWLKNIEFIGVTAGASAPDYLINDLVKFLSDKHAQVEEIITVEEKVNFSLPPELMTI